ncbi:SNF2-related protein [Marinobacterium aestuariivivens]|uniref:SNF2-related protein n=1 Tax=Marinobacterium aestuariivivens TaxID=1698799 RepID=A0ABW2A767_9GAMM
MAWPDQDRFPTNRTHHTVFASIKGWFNQSRHLLLVSGYASLDKVIDLIARTFPDQQQVRIYFGNEPQSVSRERKTRTVPDEMRDYWLKKGLSIEQCPLIEIAVRRLRAHDVEVRMPARGQRGVHAKLYCADDNTLLGSSNYTAAGLHHQIEGNVVFNRTKDKKRHQETWDLAEAIWETGECCNEWLADLIEKLMQVVTWQEALARACNELLSGEWVDLLLSMEHESGRLWPSQRDGIAQALYILDNTGAVLIADATGSGKTRMGAFLIQAIAARARAMGRLSSMCGIVCPPSVIDNWVAEVDRPGPNVRVGSSGMLGRKSKDALRIERILAQGDILLVDEAHNYHNLKSNRSQALLESVASDLLLFTATPINRSARDLLVIVNLLGADNLHDHTLKQLEGYLGGRKRISQLDPKVTAKLAAEIRQFTVRRTISQLKSYIAAQPDAYKNALDQNCSYPEISNLVYSLNEPDADCQIAREIAELASQLAGINYLIKPIKDDFDLGSDREALQRYVTWRVDAARFLAAYTVMHALRASKYVLMEVIQGHDAACNAARLESLDHNADHVGLIEKIRRNCRRMPEPAVAPDLLPSFLTAPEVYAQTVENEIKLYEAIVGLTQQLSLARERAKAQQILQAAHRHEKLLVFEERITALRVIRSLLSKMKPRHKVHLAIGSTAKSKAEICDIMGLKGKEGAHIALCSNVMAEGVNLQSASCLIMLDRPSVIRIAEQRIGRIERLDSPHSKAEVHWPLDADAFRLKRDQKFITRLQDAKRLIGSNFEVPDEYCADDLESMTEATSQDLIEKLARNRLDEISAGSGDAFHAVRSLFAGEGALIPEHLVDKMKAATGMVVSRVSLVETRDDAQWVFVCQGGTDQQPARWLLISEDEEKMTAQLDEIVAFLKGHLGPDTRDLKPTQSSVAQMERLVERLRDNPGINLSRNRLAVLEVLAQYVNHMLQVSAKEQDQQKIDYYHSIKVLLPGVPGSLLDDPPDTGNFRLLESLADAFQALLQPLRTERLKRMGNKQLVRYRDLLSKLKQQPIEFERFRKATEPALRQGYAEPPTAAVIFGINTV